MRLFRLLLLLVVFIFLTSGCDFASRQQRALVGKAVNLTITEVNVREVVELLSHPALRGRGTGQVGYEFTRDFLARELRRAGFEVTIQAFPIGSWIGAPTSWNVIGYLPGTTLDSSVVIFSAHADGEGISSSGVVRPSANDNASGVAGILAIANTFGELEKSGVSLKRSIVICFFGAEEKGKLGSKYFVGSDYFKGVRSVAVINFDMVGRGGKDSVSVIGSLMREEFQVRSPILFQMVYDFNRLFNFAIIDPDTTKSWDPFTHTDSWNFYESGVPTLFFFTGFHSDYHKSTDTADKLDYEKLEKISRFAFMIGFQLATSDVWPILVADK